MALGCPGPVFFPERINPLQTPLAAAAVVAAAAAIAAGETPSSLLSRQGEEEAGKANQGEKKDWTFLLTLPLWYC